MVRKTGKITVGRLINILKKYNKDKEITIGGYIGVGTLWVEEKRVLDEYGIVKEDK